MTLFIFIIPAQAYHICLIRSVQRSLRLILQRGRGPFNLDLPILSIWRVAVDVMTFILTGGTFW
jgi:hypothetical protein